MWTVSTALNVILVKATPKQNCSYLIKPNESAVLPIGSNEELRPSVLEDYHMCRQKGQICSRMGGALIYK